jgi:hypothetical protein
MSVHDLINSSISLLVNLDQNCYAKGSLFLDQGESVSELENWNYEYYNFVVSQKAIQVQFQEGHRGSQTGYNLESIKFLNAESLKDNDVACYLGIKNQLQPKMLTVTYIPEEKALKISADTFLNFHDIHSIHFVQSDSELNICSPTHFHYEI